MLGDLRKASKSWPAKIFFGLLTLSFVGWGIGDVIRTRFSNQPAIVVGDTKIYAEGVADQFRRDAERIQSASGGKINIDQARQMGYLGLTIQQMVTGALLDQAGQRLGLAVDDGTVRNTIAAIPAFRNQLNAFDPNLYREALRANGYSEVGFENLERRDIARGEVNDMVTEGASLPDLLVDPIFRFRYERRVAEIVSFPAAQMPVPAPPDEATLVAFHKDNAAKFMAPERRNLTALVIRGADLVADFKPTEEQVTKAYQDRQAQFTTEETRNIEEVFFADKDSAQKLVDAVNGGASFADAAKAAGKEVDDLGKLERNALPVATVADAAFAAAVPGVAGPVETPLGWNVLYVQDRQPGGIKPLAEARGEIVSFLTRDEEQNRLNALSTKLEDALGSGAGLEDAATTLGLKPVKAVEVDQAGNDADGKPVADLPDSRAFREAAFKTAKGSTSEIEPLEHDAGYFVVRIDDVAAPALRPLESVKVLVLKEWDEQQQKGEAALAARGAAERLNKGEDAAAVAGSAKLMVSEPFLRSGSPTVPPPVAAVAFKLAPGQAAAAPAGDSAFAFRLKSIEAADPKKDPAGYQETRDRLERGLASDLLQQYAAALATEYGVQVRSNLIDQQFSQSQ